jgi:hypothetical protein
MELTGGLGNQLFIWSAAHAVSKKYETKVCLFYVENSKSRQDRRIEIEDLTKNCTHRVVLKKLNLLGLFLRSIDYLSRYPKTKKLIVRMSGLVDISSPFESIENVNKHPRIIRGYFQNESMVDGCREMIESEIESEIANQLKNVDLNNLNSGVAFHVRRGDTYNLRSSVGQLSKEFYRDETIENETLFVFSENSSVRQEFDFLPDGVNYFTGERFSAWETLGMISKANRIVMANSTLSWWAAKLAIWDHMATVIIPIPWMRSLALGQGLTISEAKEKEALYLE